MKSYVDTKNMHVNAHSNFIRKSPKLGKPKCPSTGKGLNNPVHPYRGWNYIKQ